MRKLGLTPWTGWASRCLGRDCELLQASELVDANLFVDLRLVLDLLGP